MIAPGAGRIFSSSLPPDSEPTDTTLDLVFLCALCARADDAPGAINEDLLPSGSWLGCQGAAVRLLRTEAVLCPCRGTGSHWETQGVEPLRDKSTS
jgi:hypothetical protein